MTTIGYDKTLGKRVYVDNADPDSEIVCECCGAPLIAKKGDIKIHHFAHKNNEFCHADSYAPMTEWHQDWQNKFPVECREVWSSDRKHRADILIEELKLVIEFQHSHIDLGRFKTRTDAWNKLGYAVVWLWHGDLWSKTNMYHYMWDFDYSKNEFHVEMNISDEKIMSLGCDNVEAFQRILLCAGGSVRMPSYFNDMKYHDLSLLEFSARRCTTLRDVCMYMFKFSKNNEELIRKALHHEEKMNEELRDRLKAYESQHEQFVQLYKEFESTKVFSNVGAFDTSFAHTLDELFSIHDFDFIVAMDCSDKDCVTYLIDAKNDNGFYMGHIITDDGSALSRSVVLDADEERWAFISGHKNKSGYNQLHLRLCYLYALQKKFFD